MKRRAPRQLPRRCVHVDELELFHKIHQLGHQYGDHVHVNEHNGRERRGHVEKKRDEENLVLLIGLAKGVSYQLERENGNPGAG